MIEPIGWQYDLGFRIAARYGLRFFIESEYSLVERGRISNENREPTGPELTMWYKIIPSNFRELLLKLWTSEYQIIEATPEELSCALNYKKIVYLNAADFAIARTLDDFKPELDREALKSGKYGTFKNFVQIFVTRDIPQGYFYSTESRIEALNWQPSDENKRQLRPELDIKLESKITLGLRPLICD